MKISIIAAIDKNQAIGFKGDLPWYLPEDLAHFNETVDGHILICGRRTFETLPRKYQKKNTIVITSKAHMYAHDRTIASSMIDAIRKAKTLHDGKNGPLVVYVVGGGLVYQEAIGMADELILSYVDGNFAGDTFFPKVYYEKWRAFAFSKKEGFKIIKWRRRA